MSRLVRTRTSAPTGVGGVRRPSTEVGQLRHPETLKPLTSPGTGRAMAARHAPARRLISLPRAARPLRSMYARLREHPRPSPTAARPPRLGRAPGDARRCRPAPPRLRHPRGGALALLRRPNRRLRLARAPTATITGLSRSRARPAGSARRAADGGWPIARCAGPMNSSPASRCDALAASGGRAARRRR